MANDRAGHFSHDWQEPRDQVRELIVKDTRFGKITASQTARKHWTRSRIGPREQNYKLKEREPLLIRSCQGSSACVPRVLLNEAFSAFIVACE